MPKIRNKTDSKLVIEVAGEKFIHLLSRSEAEVTERDLRSSHLAGFIKKGDVRIVDKHLEEEKKKAEREAKKKAEREAKKKAEREAKKKAEEEAASGNNQKKKKN